MAVFKDAKHRTPILSGKEYRCAWHGSPRNVGLLDWIVIHDTESGPGTAKAVARWGASSAAVGHASWHFTVDDDVLVRCLPDDVISYTAYSPANDYGLHIEIVGKASWSKAEWYRHQSTLKRAAWQVARWSVLYNIPPVLLTDEEVKRKARGIMTHAQVTRVWGKGSHTDPGPNFPYRYFAYLVKRRVGWLKKEKNLLV